MTDIKFIPCPFCGNQPEMGNTSNNYNATKSIWIRCCYIKIHVAFGSWFTKEEAEKEAIYNWNHRYMHKKLK